MDADRKEIAYFQRMSFPDDWSKSNNYMQDQRSILSDALAKQDLVPVWGVRVYRELLSEVRPDGKWVDQDCFWMVLPGKDGEGFRSILVEKKDRDEREGDSL